MVCWLVLHHVNPSWVIFSLCLSLSLYIYIYIYMYSIINDEVSTSAGLGI